MEKNNNKIISLSSKSKSSQVRHVADFETLLAETKEQIEIDCFDERDREQAEEIALIIAEIMRFPGSLCVRIAGDNLPAEMVAAVYRRLAHENVAEVICRYSEATYEIKHTKSYLRTALYNSVFEMKSRIDNEVRKDAAN